MVRALAHRRCRRCLLRWRLPRAHLPDRDEPLRAHPPVVAPHGLHRLDRGLWPGGQCVPTVPDRLAGEQGGHQDSSAAVRIMTSCGLDTVNIVLQAGVDDGLPGLSVGDCAEPCKTD